MDKQQIILPTKSKESAFNIKSRKVSNEIILSVECIDVEFKTKKSYFQAVSNVSFDIKKGEILGLVGESGSGKSTIGRTLVGLNSFTNGSIRVSGIKLPNSITNIDRNLRKDLMRNIQYIFQDPLAALNPNKTIKKAIDEVFKNTYSYKKLIFNEFANIFDQYFKELDFKKLYGNLRLSSARETANLKLEEVKKEETKINDQYFNKLKSIYVTFHKKQAQNYYNQKNKTINDKEYRKVIKNNKLELKTRKQLLRVETKKALAKIHSVNNLKYTKNQFLISSKKLRKKAVNMLVKKNLTLKKFTKLINPKSINNFNQDLENKVLKTIFMANKINPITKEYYLSNNLKKVSKKTSLNFQLYKKYPHELSGGQQQRAVLARALTVDPKIIVADEPISALDVSIQAQVINSFREISYRDKISILFIAHDLNIVRNISDRILVMYRGNIVEKGTTKDIFNKAIHPYTRTLLESIPNITNYELPKTLSFKFKENNRSWFNISQSHQIFATKKEIEKWKGGHYEQ